MRLQYNNLFDLIFKNVELIKFYKLKITLIFNILFIEIVESLEYGYQNVLTKLGITIKLTNNQYIYYFFYYFKQRINNLFLWT